MNARPADNIYMRNATGIAIAAVTVLLAVAALMFQQQNVAGVEARGWVNHTFEVKGHIQELLNKLEDAQTGQRGYILTGNDEFLEPYREALRPSSNARPKSDSLDQHHSISEELAIIRRMTLDNPMQQQNIDDTEINVKQFLDYLSATVAARGRNGSAQDILDKANLRRGRELLDGLRADIRLMTAEEDHLLALRMQADAATMRQNATMIFTGLGIFYVLMVLGIWGYQRARRIAQAELLTYMQQLERSEEELKMQQEELKASNEEIEASNEELEEQNAQIRQQSEELSRSKQVIEEKAREVEQASKYKSEFLANMSHELRTPLNSLLILARSLAGNEDGNLTESQIEEANIIHNDGLELLNLINDILDLSKVEAGKLNVIAEETPLEGIVRRLQQQFAPIAGDKGVAFPVEQEDGLPATLHTDAQRVEQILKNLLSNAFKFTAQGAVTLKIHRPSGDELQRIALDPAAAVAFSVSDTGIGIDASRFKDIFEAFQQEDGSIDRHYGGTGLGLTIARKFANLLGGEIHVASKKGEGSTFTLVLPSHFEGQPAAESAAAPGEADSLAVRTPLKPMPRTSLAAFVADDRKNIADRDKVLLIIEDDKAFALTLMKIARKRGYKCLAAGDGKTGLLLAAEEPVTAVILDLKLPDIDGMQILDQLKHDLRTRHIPVHIITGRADDGNVTSLRKGAVGYLIKPVAQESIDGAFAKIEALLQAGLKRVLVVEDDQRNQVAIQNLLGKKDISLVVAGTGMAALGHLRTMAFDCVILDLRLPDMSGFDWLEKAEQESGGKGLPPVVVYTAKELNEEENRRLNRYTGSIVIKGAQSPERLLDEVTLFLHSVESTLSKDQQDIIRMQHDPDQVLQRRTVLLVDDDLRNTFALSKLLKKHGMNVIIADNGQMALDQLRQAAAVDLVIMDIMMPVMDGYEAMQKIRAIPVHRNLPIIALTARAMPEEQEKCIAAGANDYLTKPVDIERLLTLLRVWLFTHEMAA